MTRSPLPSAQPVPHSNEIEHRLTVVEVEQERHRDKLSLHEKAILALASSLYVLAQDRFPQIAAVIRGLLIP